MARVLHILLLLLAAFPVLPEDAPAKSLVLVARKDLPDPFFRESVVLVTNANTQPMGVIINKPLPVPLSELLPDLAAKTRRDRVYFGGPVQPGDALFVFRAAEAPEGAVRLMEGVYIGGRKELLKTLLERDDSTESLRVYAGHAGWAPGQLENEIARGDWALLPAEAADIFRKKPEELWPELRAKAARTKVRHTR